MMRLMLLIAAVCLMVAGCDAFPDGPSTVDSPSSSQQSRLYSQSEMSDLRVRVERADDEVAAAKTTYDQNCPPNWRSDPNLESGDLCEPMKAYGSLVRKVLDAENNCRELVDEYNAQVRRGAPSDGEIVLGATKGVNGQVIICSAAL